MGVSARKPARTVVIGPAHDDTGSLAGTEARSLGLACQAGAESLLGGGASSGVVIGVLLLGDTGLDFVAVGADDAPATLQDQGVEED